MGFYQNDFARFSVSPENNLRHFVSMSDFRLFFTASRVNIGMKNTFFAIFNFQDTHLDAARTH